MSSWLSDVAKHAELVIRDNWKLPESRTQNVYKMRPSVRFYTSLYRPWLRTRPAIHAHGQLRAIATHTYNHHATALSILPSNVDKSSNDFAENARQMGEVMARMERLHHKIEGGGPVKAKEKHLARGKMLAREYDSKRGVSLVLWLITYGAQPSYSSYRRW